MHGGAPGDFQGKVSRPVSLFGDEQLGMGHDPVFKVRLGLIPFRIGYIVTLLTLHLVEDVMHALFP
jgi:hypothetical protein